MSRERIIRLVIVIVAVVASIALADGDSAVDPDANGLLPLLLLFIPERQASTP